MTTSGSVASPRPREDIRDGLRDIFPAAVAAIPIGLLFGALCVRKGLSPLEIALMSATVCAGATQFVVHGIPKPVHAAWQNDVP
jgi:predicted branched-subunit amino acid permease